MSSIGGFWCCFLNAGLRSLDKIASFVVVDWWVLGGAGVHAGLVEPTDACFLRRLHDDMPTTNNRPIQTEEVRGTVHLEE